MKISQINFPNVKGFLQGYWRAFLLLIGVHNQYRLEQFYYRIGCMDERCLRNKQCPCECVIVYKQLEDRPCENRCYPEMLGKEEWKLYRNNLEVKKSILRGKERVEKENIEIPEFILKHLNNTL